MLIDQSSRIRLCQIRCKELTYGVLHRERQLPTDPIVGLSVETSMEVHETPRRLLCSPMERSPRSSVGSLHRGSVEISTAVRGCSSEASMEASTELPRTSMEAVWRAPWSSYVVTAAVFHSRPLDSYVLDYQSFLQQSWQYRFLGK